MVFLKTRPWSAARAAAAASTLLVLAGCQGMAPAGPERMAGGMAGGMGCCAMCHGNAGQAMQPGAAMHGHDHGHGHHGPASAQAGPAASPAAPVTGAMGMAPVQGSGRLLPQQMAAAGPMCGGGSGSSCCAAMDGAQGSCCAGMKDGGTAPGESGARPK